MLQPVRRKTDSVHGKPFSVYVPYSAAVPRISQECWNSLARRFSSAARVRGSGKSGTVHSSRISAERITVY